MRLPEPNPTIRGQARIRLISAAYKDEVEKRHADWSYDEKRQLMLRNALELDTGWSPNTVTDWARRTLEANTAISNTVYIYIHQSTVPGDARLTMLQNTYSSQTPNQVRIPDSTVLDIGTLLQTRTVQYPAPAVARVINAVGLTFETSASTVYFSRILAHSLLSTTVNQGTAQVADVQYRLTWSLD